TRSYGDWSSDVCSSDLVEVVRVFTLDLLEKRNRSLVFFAHEKRRRFVEDREERRHVGGPRRIFAQDRLHVRGHIAEARELLAIRSEERRVGKGCGSRWG